MDFVKNNWIKFPLILYVMGFLVHNIYLSKFNIYEYELIQAKYIFSGGTFLVYSVILFAVVSLKVNLTNITYSFIPDNLLPWLLRICSFPYVAYDLLHNDNFFAPNLDNPFSFERGLYFASSLAKFFFYFMLIDLFALITKGDGLKARLIRSIIRVFAVPMLLISIAVSVFNEEFRGLLSSAFFFFFGFIGLSVAQEDKILGIDTRLLHDGADKIHEEIYSIFISVISIGFIIGILMTNYVNYVYPYLPAAFGGSKPTSAKIIMKSNSVAGNILQESKNWVILKQKKTNRIHKIKTGSIEKIIYTGK